MKNPTMILAQIEQAFLANNLSDYLTAIALCGRLLHEFPFPLYVNSIRLRLSDVFVGDKLKMDQSLNLIRLRIVKLFKDFENELSGAMPSSDDEIVRRIMKVSHSNDYKARSLAMLFLSALAPVVYANKKVHFLLNEGLSCDDLTELMSAIIATGSVGCLSSEFSKIVVEKIGDMLCQEETDTSVKIRLMQELSRFQENIAVTKYCMEVARHLLQNNPDQRIVITTISALTGLAKRNGLALGDQITLILDQIGRITNNEILIECCLENLLSLASLPHHWSPEQVTKLIEYQANVLVYESSKTLIIWLQILNSLSKHATLPVLSSAEFFDSLLKLINVGDVVVKINLMEVMYAYFKRLNQPNIAVRSCMLGISNELSNPESNVSLKDRAKFLKLLLTFAKEDGWPELQVSPTYYFQYLTTFLPPYPQATVIQSLEAINELCNINDNVGHLACKWAFDVLEKHYSGSNNKQLCDAPLELYSIVLHKHFPDYQAQLDALINSIQQELCLNKKWWFAYRLTRQAFRYGHFKSVALPLLEKIQANCNTVEVSSFMMSLICISKAQLPKDFDWASLNLAKQNLRRASLLLTPLVQNSRNSDDFKFAADFTDALYDLFGALSMILVIINSNMGYLPTGDDISHMERYQIAFENVANEFYSVRQKFGALQKKSFDADEESRQQIELFSRYCSLFELLLSRIFASDITPLQPFAKIATSPINRSFEDNVLNLTTGQINTCIVAVTGTLSERVSSWRNNFIQFCKLFRHLSTFQLYLPRAFFQQLSKTKIRLNVTPQPKETENAFSLSTKQLALTVEGAIETNNPKPIQNVSVDVKVFVEKNLEPELVDSRQCQVNDNYFKVNFLLKIEKNADIVTSLRFTDSVDKQNWEVGDLNRFSVIAYEVRE